jgi:hypothetical protein
MAQKKGSINDPTYITPSTHKNTTSGQAAERISNASMGSHTDCFAPCYRNLVRCLLGVG